jgi:hypothetical protein
MTRKQLLISVLEHLETSIQLMDEHPERPDDSDTLYELVDRAREHAEAELNRILVSEIETLLL